MKFTGNPYRTHINVNGRHLNTSKLVFLKPVYTGIRSRTRVYVNAPLTPDHNSRFSTYSAQSLMKPVRACATEKMGELRNARVTLENVSKKN